MKKIVLANLASPANPGDFAILLGSLKLLREYYKDSQITLVTRHFSEKQAYDGLGCHVIPSYPHVEHIATESAFKKAAALPRTLFSRNEMAEAVRGADIVFLIGGGYFYSYRSAGPGLNFLSYCLPAYFAGRYGKPVVHLPQSYGPLKSAVSRRLLGEVLKRSEVVFFREAISGSWLQSKYPSGQSRYRFMPDLAFLLEPSDIGVPMTNTDEKRSMGVTVRPWRVDRKGSQAYLHELEDALVWVHETLGLKIKIVAQVLRPTSGESDEQASETLAANLRKRIPSRSVELKTGRPYFSLDELCRIYQSCDFLIAMRLHSAILSFVMERPALVVGYQHKAKGVIKALSLDPFFVNSFEAVTSKELREACRRIKAMPDSGRKEIRQAVDTARMQIRTRFFETMRTTGL